MNDLRTMKYNRILFRIIVFLVLFISKGYLFTEMPKDLKIGTKQVWNKILDLELQNVTFPSSDEIIRLMKENIQIVPRAIITEKWIGIYDSLGNLKNKIVIENKKEIHKRHIVLSRDCKTIFVVTAIDNAGYNYRVMDFTGKVFSERETPNYPSISTDGNFVLFGGASNPIESFEIYDNRGNKLWDRGKGGDIFVIDVKILDDGRVVSIEKNNNGKIKVVLLDQKGNVKWEYLGIEPLSVDYTFVFNNNILTISPNTFPTAIYTFNSVNGNLLWKKERAEIIPKQISEDGRSIACESRDGIVLINNLTGDIQFERSGLKGNIEISPTGEFLGISIFTSEPNKNNLFIMNNKGVDVWSVNTSVKKIEKIKFITNDQFLYTNGKNIIIQKIMQKTLRH